jgi:hypothetical protein
MAHSVAPESRSWIGLSAQGDLGPWTIYTDRYGKTVYFLRAPPLNPPSTSQEYLRELFRNAATAWRQAAPATRADWRTAARKCNLGISGYCLWIWFTRTRDEQRLRTIERQSGITLERP